MASLVNATTHLQKNEHCSSSNTSKGKPRRRAAFLPPLRRPRARRHSRRRHAQSQGPRSLGTSTGTSPARQRLVRRVQNPARCTPKRRGGPTEENQIYHINRLKRKKTTHDHLNWGEKFFIWLAWRKRSTRQRNERPGPTSMRLTRILGK